MKLNIVNKIRVSLMSAFLVMLILFFISSLILNDLISESSSVVHTNEVQRNIEALISHTKDGESSLRGFIAVKDEALLAPFKESRVKTDSVYHVLKALVNDNATQVKNLDTLYSYIQKKYALLSVAIATFKNDSLSMSPELKEQAFTGTRIMDTIKTKARAMEGIEKALLKKRKATFDSTSSLIKNLNIVAAVGVVLIAIFTFVTYNKENKDKIIASEKAILYRQELENRIDELNNANKELINLRSIEKFAATGRISRTIAHEIRNPLTNIGLATEQIKEEIGDNENTEMLFEMITRNVNRINQLITDLLTSTKFAQLEFEETDVNTLMDEALELVLDRLELKGIELKKIYNADNCKVLIDKEKLKIAFVNIIVNAVEAMEEKKGKLTISTSSSDNKCMITISDNGQGIPRETLNNIFEPYYTSKKKGNGLGLTNTQNIILNHKGKIYVESEIGKGTSFFIELNASS